MSGLRVVCRPLGWEVVGSDINQVTPKSKIGIVNASPPSTEYL